MQLEWPTNYPRQEDLRREVECMVEAAVEVMVDPALDLGVTGVYFKGSAKKRWDSVIDYVPELSDIDLHLLVHDEAKAGARLGTIAQSIDIQRRIEEGYLARAGEARHLPRLQIIILNRLLRAPDYTPSPKGTVKTLYGQEPAEPGMDDARERDIARRKLIADAEILQSLPMRIMDKPGRQLLAVLNGITWRVSPVAPRVMCLLGVPAAKAWSLNRTEAVKALVQAGQEQLAKAYVDFYMGGWGWFLSGRKDTEALRAAVAAGCEVLALGAALGAKG